MPGRNRATPLCHSVAMISLMSAAVTDQVDAVQWDETRDTVAQHFLGLTAADFVERYTSGAFAEDTPGLMAVLSLFPELD